MANNEVYNLNKNVKGKILCKVCQNSFKEGDFYTKADKVTKVDRCKKCFTKGVKNDDPKTIIPLLKELDIPWIEGEWKDEITRRKSRFPNDCEGGQGVFGKYKVSMGKSIYKDFRFKDSKEATDLYNSMEHNINVFVPPTQEEAMLSSPNATFVSEEIDLGSELTEEEKQALYLKWGTSYTINECIQLEKNYVKMEHSFPIEDQGRDDDTMWVCKIGLKANQALDRGDFDSFKKLMDTRDKIMKSGKFTTAQNKDGKVNNINSIAKLVEICEKQKGFIPRFCTDIPQDIVDFTLQDQKRYLYNLVMKDLGIGKQFEHALKKIQEEQEKEKRRREAEEKGEVFRDNEVTIDLYQDLRERINQDSKNVDEEDFEDYEGDFEEESNLEQEDE